MPEIAEIARAVHFLRLHLVGKTIKSAIAVDDANVFGKVGTSGPEFAVAMTGKKVLSAGTQGKYFWLVLDKPPHPVMHFGMTGWMHVKGDQTAYTNYYKSKKPEELEEWPPKYWKFQLKTEEDPVVEVAYTDPRRFGRVRLVDCPGDSIRKHSPLVENGPDPVVDTDIFTEEYLEKKMRSRHVPIKALLLDQAFLSGIGNWVGDEVLYQAKLHPEQYCNDFSDAEIKELYRSIRYVCQLAVDKLGDSDQFPETWLFNHRWGKGKKASKLPNGEKLAFVTVGGRTSCFAPNVQKKTGKVAPGIKEEPIASDEEEPKPAKAGKAKKPAKAPKIKQEEEKPTKRKIKDEDDADKKPLKKTKAAAPKKTSSVANGVKSEGKKTTDDKVEVGRRRSGRLQGK
ncbi:hypothetical protein QBC37DRAFT_75331 [Rhypophila decipiens]|uniref:Formamidopyrimidine-DNA glycosylase catalytic domain-containing protein n=1 Tax=Rhypophila decipiens TaxID=261697 RepID=A0AAN6YLG3_9PEZI|nr:hypothetical protein QBC37DRAFT_75331 [Rhypophila decipiens]